MADFAPGYISHVDDSGKKEYLIDHLSEVSEMSAEFAGVFGAESWARAIGLLHDVGKYSDEFQNRILCNGPSVDHSSAGAWLLSDVNGGLLSYCVAGHHGGMPNGVAEFDSRRAGLADRMIRSEKGEIPNFDAYKKEIKVDLRGLNRPNISCTQNSACFAFSFWVRMLFSCLVDADYLCTERFMDGASRDSLDSVAVQELRDLLEKKVSAFFPPKTPINEARCSVLDDCLKASRFAPGVYSITAPTGSGKTYALMRFALNHACVNGMRRVICAEPYTSIIEQNADVYRSVFGPENVLEHHSNFDFSVDENEFNRLNRRLRLATENWDAPIVVTTNVQLFESLLSNKASRCRKLHNIAGSVIVLDEAQMIPTKYLTVCVKSLSELVKNYGCTVVLCSATQPALNDFFRDQDIDVQEIIADVETLFSSLQRVTYDTVGILEDEQLVESLLENDQALCIVNSRRQARNVYEMLKANAKDGRVYHLTTLMHAEHRTRVLGEVNNRLSKGLPCIVVATSLVEAGVDLDFPIVFRAACGIDSIVQAAGRCNREMKHSAAESRVVVFETSANYSLPREVEQHASIARSVMLGMEQGSDFPIDSVEMIEAYFSRLYAIRGLDGLDAAGVAKILSGYGITTGSKRIFDIPFETAANRMKFIDEDSFTVVVPADGYEEEIAALNRGDISRLGMRKLSRISVSVYKGDLDKLNEAGAVESVGDGLFLLLDADRYKESTGLDSAGESGSALFW